MAEHQESFRGASLRDHNSQIADTGPVSRGHGQVQTMAHFMRAGALRHHRSALSKPSFGYRFLATKTYDPLRILFCGADEFSIASLKALHEEHVRRPDRISSIDVVCRPGKRVGRGLKNIREGTLSTFKDQYAWNYAHSLYLVNSPYQGGRNRTFTSNS